MKEKIKEWLREKQKKKLMNKFLGAILDADKQQAILKQLINSCDVTNQNLLLLSRGAISKPVLNELHRLILFNEPSKNDLCHLIRVSNNEFVIKRAMKKLEGKYHVTKDDWFSLLGDVRKDWVAWEVFGKLKRKGLCADELYVIVRTVKSESVAYFAFKMLLEIILSDYGIPAELIGDELRTDPAKLN